ncbi:LysR family transcriptional regulator [Rhodococcoides fascians A21d2]|uniref:LysR family transcriptional regulator n=1 Tax=Rhodococcoides fascians TaxID=1828 RepID=UPI000560E761|nr:LysR family transcriptional regulator [Rhodococcus fascians]QII01454.1 LysR family transcriptional regulator [Rhodococcus fascians A21d2]
MLDPRRLRMLAELERLGTIAAVAECLRQTAPGVSMQLAALEREVGVALTEKNGRNVRLTPAGRVLAGHGVDVVERLTLAEVEIRALRDGASGTYRVAAFPSAARTIIAATWAALRTSGAGSVQLELIEMEPDESMAALRSGDADLAVTHTYSTMEPVDARNVSLWPLRSESVWLAVPAGRQCAAPADLRDFANDDWLAPRRERSCYDMVFRACGAAGFVPRVVAEATDFAVLLALVDAGAGVALVPDLAVDRLPSGVRLVELAQPVNRHLFCAARTSSATDPGLRCLRNAIDGASAALVRDPADITAR